MENGGKVKGGRLSRNFLFMVSKYFIKKGILVQGLLPVSMPFYAFNTLLARYS